VRAQPRGRRKSSAASRLSVLGRREASAIWGLARPGAPRSRPRMAGLAVGQTRGWPGGTQNPRFPAHLPWKSDLRAGVRADRSSAGRHAPYGLTARPAAFWHHDVSVTAGGRRRDSIRAAIKATRHRVAFVVSGSMSA
jgi:hypothetical protein